MIHEEPNELHDLQNLSFSLEQGLTELLRENLTEICVGSASGACRCCPYRGTLSNCSQRNQFLQVVE